MEVLRSTAEEKETEERRGAQKGIVTCKKGRGSSSSEEKDDTQSYEAEIKGSNSYV